MDPKSPNFLYVNKVKLLLNLTKTEPVEAEFIVAGTFLQMDPTQCSSKIGIVAFVNNADCAVGTETWINIWGI